MARDSIWSCLDLHLEMEKTLQQTIQAIPPRRHVSWRTRKWSTTMREPIWWPCHDEFGIGFGGFYSKVCGYAFFGCKIDPQIPAMSEHVWKSGRKKSKTPKWRSSVPSNHVIRFSCFVLVLSLFRLQSSAGILVAPPNFGNFLKSIFHIARLLLQSFRPQALATPSLDALCELGTQNRQSPSGVDHWFSIDHSV